MAKKPFIPARQISSKARIRHDLDGVTSQELAERFGINANKAQHLALGHPTNIAYSKAASLTGELPSFRPTHA